MSKVGHHQFVFTLNTFWRCLIIWLALASVPVARADNWAYWSGGFNPSLNIAPKLANDGTNIYYTSLLGGVYRASLEDRHFTPMPMTGFPLWTAENTNGFGLWNIGVAPRGTLLISGSPIRVSPDGITIGNLTNTLPMYYFWDETAQQWQAAAVTGKSYPYTIYGGNFANAPDGSVWTCSGFAPYVYRSTNDGRSFVAFNLDERVPTNYFPFVNGSTSYGRIFNIFVTPANEVIAGTETGGFVHSYDNGQTWTSLAPDFTSTNSVNPLGRVGNATVSGMDRYGNVLLQNTEVGPFPAAAQWWSVSPIGYRPADGSYFKANYGLPFGYYPSQILTTMTGQSFTYMNQNHTLQGGIYRSHNGTNWTQFNDGTPLTEPFAPHVPTNAQAPGHAITVIGPRVFIAAGGMQIWVYDTSPPPVTNYEPIAVAQNVNLLRNSPADIMLEGSDGNGDFLNFEIAAPPRFGTLEGTPPYLVYTPSNNYTGLDSFLFTVSDGITNSLPANVNLAINAPATSQPVADWLSPSNGSWFLAPASITLAATASAPNGIRFVSFYHGSNLLATVTNAPFSFVWTNVSTGDYSLSVRATDNSNTRIWLQPVSVSVLPTEPRLHIQPISSSSVAISWPLTLKQFYFESAYDPAGPWTLAPFSIFETTNSRTVTVPTLDQHYFRLSHPR